MDERVVNIRKTDEDIKRCSEIVKNVIEQDLSSEQLKELTIQIMDTSLNIGGDYGDGTIEQIAIQYRTSGGVERFLKGYKK